MIELVITDPRLESEGGLQYATPGAAAIDMRACIADPIVLCPGDVRKVDLGCRIHLRDPNLAAQLLPRSGLGTKGLVLANGTGLIDSDYQGPLVAALLNRKERGSIVIQPMDRICQMIIVPIVRPVFRQVFRFSNETARGAGGFGSTGAN